MSKINSQVWAWYLWPVAGECFGNVATGVLQTMMLTDIATKVGYLSPDYTVPCTSTSSSIADTAEVHICRANVLGHWIETTAFTMYTKSISMVLIISAILILGPLADDPFRRKTMMMGFTTFGSIISALLLLFSAPFQPSAPSWAALICILGSLSYFVTATCYNGYLPTLARNSAASENEDDEHTSFAHSGGIVTSSEDLAQRELRYGSVNRHGGGAASESDRLLGSIDEEEASAGSPTRGRHTVYNGTRLAGAQYSSLGTRSKDISLLMSRMSSTSLAIGSAASVLCQVVLMVALTNHVRLTVCFASIGIWWLVVSLPVVSVLSSGKPSSEKGKIVNQSAPPAGDDDVHMGGGRDEQRKKDAEQRRTALGLGRTVALIKSLKPLTMLRRALIAWLIHSDAYHTVPMTLILQSQTRLGIPSSTLVILGASAMGIGAVTSILVPRLQPRLGFTNLQGTMSAAFIGSVAPLIGCTSLLVPSWGISSKAILYITVHIFGVGYGWYFSYARAVYAEMIPKGHESSFFSLFALADRSASFVGPLIVATITQQTGRFDLAYVFLFLSMVLAVPILYCVDVAQGVKQAQAWEEVKSER